jgi:site-specific DNA-methyltransferase (adenine-specific)
MPESFIGVVTTIAVADKLKFETWIIQQAGGMGQNKKGGDKGIDGKMSSSPEYTQGTPIQVKRSDNVGVNVVKNFSVSAKQANKTLFEKNQQAKYPVGYIIAFSFGKGAVEEAARLKNTEGIIIKLVTVGEIVPVAVKPSIAVHINELSRNNEGGRKIEFIASGDSPSGIEFYSWDFNYDAEKRRFKPTVMIDKDGRQVLDCKPGIYTVAVKAVDNDGIENMETLTLKINGKVERVAKSTISTP